MHDLPEGFTVHDGGACPIDGRVRARMAILTVDGVAITELQQARYHEWEHSKHDGLIGAVVGYEPPMPLPREISVPGGRSSDRRPRLRRQKR